jgi:SAM-dependent methyltransferase
MTTTHEPTRTDVAADAELKAKHRRMWALGNYPSVATHVVAELGPTVVQATGITPGDRVLDIAAGSGNASVPAVQAGADEVVATDLSPVLLEAGRAENDDPRITWQEADAEALPFEDASFDTVISCLGVMFAPHHQQAADELLRVARPGARIGVLNWTPEGFIGQMFATMKPYAPAPPPGVQPPPLWGAEDHVRELFGDRVEDVVAPRRRLRVDRFASAGEFREFFKARYGPTIAVYKANATDPERCAALDRDLDALAERYGAASGLMEWEYLVLTARRR